jgi:hypothetical protein
MRPADGPDDFVLTSWEDLRKAVLEDLFARTALDRPFALCPTATDRATMLDWLDPAWGAAGIECAVLKGSEQKSLPGKSAGSRSVHV